MSPRAAGVPQDVGQRFLDDPHEGVVHVFGQLAEVALDLGVDVTPASLDRSTSVESSLLSAAQALRERAGHHVYGDLPDDEQRQDAAERAQAALGPDAYNDAVEVGRSLDPNEAVAYAVNGRHRQFAW